MCNIKFNKVIFEGDIKRRLWTNRRQTRFVRQLSMQTSITIKDYHEICLVTNYGRGHKLFNEINRLR